MNLKKYIKQVNIPMVLTTGTILSLILQGMTIGGALAIFAVCGLYSFKMYLDYNKKMDYQEVYDKKIKELQEEFNAKLIKVQANVQTIKIANSQVRKIHSPAPQNKKSVW